MDRVREWAALIGRRNIAYVVFVSLLVPFGMLMEAAGPQGPDSGGGIMAAIILWGVVSLIFFGDGFLAGSTGENWVHTATDSEGPADLELAANPLSAVPGIMFTSFISARTLPKRSTRRIIGSGTARGGNGRTAALSDCRRPPGDAVSCALEAVKVLEAAGSTSSLWPLG